MRSRLSQSPVIDVGAFVVSCAVVGLLAACSPEVTSTDETIKATAGAPAASPGSSVRSGSPSGSPTDVRCEELPTTTTAIVSTVAELGRLVGTQDDATSLLEQVGGFAPALGGLVPVCAPEAEDAMWRFLTRAEEMRQLFSSGTGKTEMAATKIALVSVRTQGADLFQRLGIDGAGWSDISENARLACRDMRPLGARLTWQVRHLANLIGSDNVQDSEGYLVDMPGLTSALAELVAQCRTKATAAMIDFASAMDRLRAVYQPGSSPSVVEADKGALGTLRARGISLYSSLGISPDSWEVIPAAER